MILCLHSGTPEVDTSKSFLCVLQWRNCRSHSFGTTTNQTALLHKCQHNICQFCSMCKCLFCCIYPMNHKKSTLHQYSYLWKSSIISQVLFLIVLWYSAFVYRFHWFLPLAISYEFSSKESSIANIKTWFIHSIIFYLLWKFIILVSFKR